MHYHPNFISRGLPNNLVPRPGIPVACRQASVLPSKFSEAMIDTMKRLIIFGIGQIADVAHYMFTEDSDYDIAGFTVDDDYRDRYKYFGLPVIPFESIQDTHSPDEFMLFIAMGFGKVNVLREAKLAEALAKGYDFASYTSSSAWVWRGYEEQPNTMVMEQNTIQPYVTIGENSILWSGNHIGHHSKIGKNVFIASHAVVSGAVTVGDNCFICVNATIRDNVALGSHCVVGAGALIVNDAQDRTVFPSAATEASKVPSHRLQSI